MTDSPDMPDLRHAPDAWRVVKRPVALDVRFAEADGTCDTLEGPVRFRAGDAILTGTLGENWPVSRERFDETYELVSDGRYRKRPLLAYAIRLTAPMKVRVGGQGDVVEGHPGDWLVQYDESDYGLVDAEVFAQAYERADAPG
ncbi:PGDYG domain-containing protein [Caballeronia sp. Lep1P3]|uniref:PGDYG domain-containing protein n=1 Tax=Caballeronia sp. Lep1P3 TaxID=2878150 RepID=UPI001FD2B8BB|nr:PGDYG domain-containing protein [Caballeronia sp. Lep1P3]